MPYANIDEWIREENGHQASHKDQIITAYWFYRSDVIVSHGVNRRTSEIRDELEEILDYDVEVVLDNLADIGVLEKTEPSSRVFIRNERTGDAFFSPADDEFPPNLYKEISRLVYDIHLREGLGEEGPYPGRLQVPTIAPVADGGNRETFPTDDGHSNLRLFVANQLGVDPSDVEDALVEPDDHVDCMEQFDDIVSAIIDSDAVTRRIDYDRVGWQNRANRWSLSETAKRVEENETLPI